MIVQIERIAAGGDGVGRLDDGLTVFVPRTAPGDSVEVAITERKPRFARGRIARLAGPSSMRVDPPCPHYTADDCGGCQLQHVTAEGQVEIKGRIVGDALRRIGGRDVADPGAVPSPDAWRYRSKITLAVQGDVAGLRPLGNPGGVFQLRDCLITREPLMRAWEQLSGQRRLMPPSLSSIVLREDRDGGIHVVMVAGTDPWDPAPLAAVVPAVSLWWHPEGGAPRIVAGKRTGFPVLAFEQTNSGLASRIRADAVAALGPVQGEVVWDLFGGVGDTARMLAAGGAKVWSVDADRGAIEWARRDGSGTSYLGGRVEDVLSQLPTPHAVIVNPPRTGMHERVTSRLESWRLPAGGRRLVYISCDPATLARDLKRLRTFRLISVAAYDLFPQTAHVESLAVLGEA